MYFGKLVFESDEQEFSLRGVKSKKISSHPGRDVLKSALKVRDTEMKMGWVNTWVGLGCVNKYGPMSISVSLTFKTIFNTSLPG